MLRSICSHRAADSGITLAGFLILLLLSAGIAGSTSITRVNVTTTGLQANGHSSSPVISADGQYVLFSTLATNLASSDTDTSIDTYLRDVWTPFTRGPLAKGYGQVFTPDGQAIIQARAEGLVRYNIATRTSEMLVVKNQYYIFNPAISANGRFIAFNCYDGQMVPGDTNNQSDVFLFDTQTQALEIVSLTNTGEQGNGSSGKAAVSGDGRYVAFVSSSRNMLPNGNNFNNIYVRDRELGTTTCASVTSTGAPAICSGSTPSISDDGRLIMFTSAAPLVAPGSGINQVYIFDQQTHAVSCVSVAPSGALGNGNSNHAAMSADGRYVAFCSQSYNLVANDLNQKTDVFLRDRINGTTTLVSRSVSAPSNGDSGYTIIGNNSYGGVAISSDGRYIAFGSSASNLTPGDTNSLIDVFLVDRGSAQPDLWIRGAGSTAYLGDDFYQTISEQTVEQTVRTSGSAAIFELAVQNDGEIEDTLNVTGPAGSGGWTVRYFDARTEGTDITAQVTGDGWAVENLAPGASREFRVEITPNITLSANATQEALVAVRSAHDANKIDTAEAMATYQPLSAVSLSTDLAAPRPVNATITLTATPTGGDVVEYRFRARYVSNGIWQWPFVRGWSTSHTCTWTPTVPARYTVMVYARERGETTVVSRAISFLITPALSAVSLAASPPSPQPANTGITLTATPTGGATVQYMFRVGYVADGVWTWTVLRNFAVGRTCLWTPAVARNYTLVVYARDITSPSTPPVTRVIGYKVTEAAP